MFRRNFLFGKDGGTANLIDVGSEDLYQPGKGYGFVTEKNRREQKLLQIRELNSSFDTMITNVCDIVPVGYSRIFADKTVDIAVLADRPRISALTVEEVNGPTVYLAGDSTVTDQPGDYPYYPGTCYCGWGQMLPAYFDTRVACLLYTSPSPRDS